MCSKKEYIYNFVDNWGTVGKFIAKISLLFYWMERGDMGKSPFWIENIWLRLERFKDGIQGWWQNYQFHGS